MIDSYLSLNLNAECSKGPSAPVPPQAVSHHPPRTRQGLVFARGTHPFPMRGRRDVEARSVPAGVREDFNGLRTKLETFFSILD